MENHGLSWDGQFLPRRWQREAGLPIIKALRSGKSPVVSAIMGAGKSVLIAELVAHAFRRIPDHGRIVVCAPRQRLVHQLSETISLRLGTPCGLYYAKKKSIEQQVIVTCNQSMLNLARALDRAGFYVACLVGDEVHNSEADLFKEACERMAPKCKVGFTATPFRSNEKESLSLWDSVVYLYGAQDALEDEVIVPWVLKHWDGRGDARRVDSICMTMIRRTTQGPGIVSALDIQDAETYAEMLRTSGCAAKAIHSRLTDHEQALRIEELRSGKLRCLVHVSMLSEGVDFPWLKWICLRRPVGAKVRFVQEVGRVLRAYPGKKYAVILDPHDLFGRHNLSHPAKLGDVMEDDKEERELLAKLKKLSPEEIKKVRKMPPAVAFGHMESWVRGILVRIKTRIHGAVDAQPFVSWKR
jgi:superfamily II DNA or RNA helicase